MKHYAISEIDDKLTCLGRTYRQKDPDMLHFNWTCSGVEFVFCGTCLTALLAAYAAQEIDKDCMGNPCERSTWPWVAVFLDDDEVPYKRFELSKPEDHYLIFQSESEETHRIKMVKLTENLKTGAALCGMTAQGNFLKNDAPVRKKIEFIGDSITCGFGNETQDRNRAFFSDEENGWLSHAAIAARRLGMDWSMVCISGICLAPHEKLPLPYAMNELYEYTDRVLEDRLGKKEYQRWNFQANPVDYLVVNLGTNDTTAIMASQDPDATEEYFHKAYLAFLKMLRAFHGPDTKIICALGSMDYYLYHRLTRIVEEYQKTMCDENVWCFRYPRLSVFDPLGACGHPHVKTHEKMAQALVRFVNTLEGNAE